MVRWKYQREKMDGNATRQVLNNVYFNHNYIRIEINVFVVILGNHYHMYQCVSRLRFVRSTSRLWWSVIATHFSFWRLVIISFTIYSIIKTVKYDINKRSPYVCTSSKAGMSICATSLICISLVSVCTIFCYTATVHVKLCYVLSFLPTG
jgi:hypothetical protein